MQTLRKFIFYPFSLLYSLLVSFRNFLFDIGILKQQSFDIPIISVGNLCMGGAGKTPHTEYIARLLLSENYKIAILSRGYGRKTKGFIEVTINHTATEVGDEPLLYKKRFGEKIIVAVDEKRTRGIKNLLQKYTDLQVIILDDAFQHRWVKPGLNILLTDYYQPYWEDYIFPAGTLREARKESKRADIIVVTKSPIVVSPIDRRDIEGKIKLSPHQKLFFSKINYFNWHTIYGGDIGTINKTYTVIFLLTGIANPYPLALYLKKFALDVEVMSFPDHHFFNEKELKKVLQQFNDYISPNKAMITTEKDLMRLKENNLIDLFQNIELYYIPIEVVFHKEDDVKFNKTILDYVKENTKNS